QLPLMSECADFISNRLDVHSVLLLRHFYRAISYEKSNETMLRFTDSNFVPLAHTPSFLKLSFNDLLDLLRRDTLHVDTENQVFNATSIWLYNNPEMIHHGPELLKCIRWPLLSSSFFTEIVEKTEWVMDNAECREIVEKAKEYGITGESGGETILFSTTERKCEDVPRLIATFG
ncbi:hypothetical protein PENTCL1PPCAC_10309, partial [Pristionchus entomophagus]